MATTLKQQITADVAPVFLNEDEFAEEVTRHVLGVEDAETDVTVTAVVDLDEEALEQPTSQLNTKSGKKIARRGRLEVPASVAVDDRDRWTVQGELWRTLRIGGRDADLITVEIQRLERQSTRLPEAPIATP